MRYQFAPGIVALLGVVLLGIGLVGGRLPLTVVGFIVIALAPVRYLVGRRSEPVNELDSGGNRPPAKGVNMGR